MQGEGFIEKFNDKTAIVTGGGSGIGRALCRELGKRGAVVIAADINFEGAGETAASIPKAKAVSLDVAKPEDVKKLIHDTANEYGKLDYIFNNAGIVIIGEVRDLDDEHWRRQIDVNLMGVVYGTTTAYKMMVKQGFGHIINTASMAGLMGTPAFAPYSLTKHGVVGLSTALRAEGEGLNVKVSVVCPGFVQTPMATDFNAVNVDREKFAASIPNVFVSAEKAARIILDGVAKNKAIIAFPFAFRLVWWLYRIHPSLAAPLARKMIKDFRSTRLDA